MKFKCSVLQGRIELPKFCSIVPSCEAFGEFGGDWTLSEAIALGMIFVHYVGLFFAEKDGVDHI